MPPEDAVDEVPEFMKPDDRRRDEARRRHRVETCDVDEPDVDSIGRDETTSSAIPPPDQTTANGERGRAYHTL